MTLLFGIFAVTSLITLYFGLYFLFEGESEQTIWGVSILVWLGLGNFLFYATWLPDSRHDPYSFWATLALSVSGYMVGRLIGTATRPDWAEDLRELARRRAQ